MTLKTKVAIVIEGPDLDVRWVTAQVGFEPTGSTGTARHAHLPRRGNTWVYAIDTPPDSPLDEKLGRLLEPFSAVDLDAWRTVARRYDVKAFCGVFLSSDNSEIEVSTANLQTMGRLGLRLILDMYCL